MAWTVAPDVGRRLQELRAACGWTQRDLALVVGRQKSSVSYWERGVKSPPRGVLERLAARYGWPVEIFAKGGPRPGSVITAPVAVDGGTAEPAELGEVPDFAGAGLEAAYQRAVEDVVGWAGKDAGLRAAAARALRLLQGVREAARADAAVSAKALGDVAEALRIELRVNRDQILALQRELAERRAPKAG